MDLPGLDYNFLEAKVSLAFFSPPPPEGGADDSQVTRVQGG